MNDQCKLQYHEEGGMNYVGPAGALAGCQGFNPASHLWYPTSQAQSDAVTTGMLSNAFPLIQNQRICTTKTNLFNFVIISFAYKF